MLKISVDCIESPITQHSDYYEKLLYLINAFINKLKYLLNNINDNTD